MQGLRPLANVPRAPFSWHYSHRSCCNSGAVACAGAFSSCGVQNMKPPLLAKCVVVVVGYRVIGTACQIILIAAELFFEGITLFCYIKQENVKPNLSRSEGAVLFENNKIQTSSNTYK